MLNLAYNYKGAGKSSTSFKSVKSGKGSSTHGGSIYVTGFKYILPMNYGGLGNLFFDQLSSEPDKILQVSRNQENKVVLLYYFQHQSTIPILLPIGVFT